LEIIPAIDIRGGRCVRLEQGDYDRETVFGDDPAAMARRWEHEGAHRLHVVDLDGARAGHPVNADVIRDVIHAVSIAVQVGGGLREVSAMEAYLKAGADRVVIGTAAIKDQETLVNAVSLFRDLILVGVDARNGMVSTEGWREQSEVQAVDLVRQLSEFGVRRIFYTDVGRDGILSGPNVEAVREIIDTANALPSPLAVIASGGVSSVSDLLELASIGAEGAIVGKALYTGALDLGEALRAVSPQG
jgi:phosphoribosylformimino-5-aminoimidazole carboxamide ribotide isomerase